MTIHNMLNAPLALGKGLVLLSGSVAIGATGAVGAITGTGFAATAVGSLVGSIVRDDVGTYTFTLPGSGEVKTLFASVTLVEPTKDLKWQLLSKTDADRELVLEIKTNGTEAVAPADADLTSGGEILYFFVCKTSSV